MKLYNFDCKNNEILSEMELGDISIREQELIFKVLSFLDDEKITSNHCLILAKDYSRRLVLKDENKIQIVFNY